MNIIRIVVGIVAAVLASLIAMYVIKLPIIWVFVFSGAVSGIAMAIVPSRVRVSAYRVE